MNIPFTIDQFLEVFEKYNLAVWPMQIFLVVLAVVALLLSLKKTAYGDKIISVILAFFWLWTGIVYHLTYFTSINRAAYLFGSLFIIHGLVFLYAGVLKSRLSFKLQPNAYGVIGGLFIIYALVVYPIIGHLSGHGYPRNPTFGLPCPTTIFTFGLVLWTDKVIPKYVLLIPAIWSIIGFSAAVSLNFREDFGLVIAGVLGVILFFFRDKKR